MGQHLRGGRRVDGFRPEDDRRLLRRRSWPRPSATRGSLRIVDLFCGAGGMSLGCFLAARDLGLEFELALAVESDPAIGRIYESNFSPFLIDGGRIVTSPVESVFDGNLESRRRTHRERAVRAACGDVTIVTGGPPCQGNSDLNNHTRRDDSRNQLYERAVRAAVVLEPELVLIENVPPVVHDRDGVVDRSEEVLLDRGYAVTHCVLPFDRSGAPQRRRRHLMIGLRDDTPEKVEAVARILTRGTIDDRRTVRWAIEDLRGRAEDPGSGGFDAPARPSDDNRRRLAWFAANPDEWVLPNAKRPPCHRGGGHSYKSIYGRMRWNEPSQTITTGFGSMGQGCYVHPDEPRTITPHEAARLQTFPDFFEFESATNGRARRTIWGKAIGNAVPPFAMREVAVTLMMAKDLRLPVLTEGIQTTLPISS